LLCSSASGDGVRGQAIRKACGHHLTFARELHRVRYLKHVCKRNFHRYQPNRLRLNEPKKNGEQSIMAIEAFQR
jgi:hypothetical protein